MTQHPLRYAAIALIISLLFIAGSGVSALAQNGETIVITSPADGATVSGLITVTGTIDFPNFLKYELFLKTGDQMIWGATVYAPVIDGDLAFLDTRTVLDGTYQLIIRKVSPDSNYTEATGPTIIIENNLGAPQPFPEIESSPLYPPPSGALARVRNCSGDPLEFDYTSPDGFCSAADLWINPKLETSPICPYVDILLIPCEYRGTAIGMGQPRGATYSFDAVAGRVYELTYPGGDRLFIGDVTGRLSSGLSSSLKTPVATSAAATPAAVAPAATAAPASASSAAPAPTSPAESSTETRAILPESGRGTNANSPFVFVAGGLILFLVVGGIVAARKRGYTG